MTAEELVASLVEEATEELEISLEDGATEELVASLVDETEELATSLEDGATEELVDEAIEELATSLEDVAAELEVVREASIASNSGSSLEEYHGSIVNICSTAEKSTSEYKVV